MAGATPRFGFTYFDYGDTLSSPLNVRKEIERFTLIDRQMFGMASIFGDGVISGWEVKETANLGISISAGLGLLNGKVLESVFSNNITSLQPNALLNVYAIPNPSSAEDRFVQFKVSLVELTGAMLIATVQTGGTNIEIIDSTVRSKIGFREAIAEEIAEHRHDGTTSPKIDLTQEVQGQLPTSRMADIDASKIVGGRLPVAVLPTIDHSRLKNIGLLTHAQIDSLVQSIQKDNIALMGEIASINLMKMIAYMKYLDVDVDKYFVNELCIIPGVSPDSYIDFDNSNANIDLVTNCISGIPEMPVDFDAIFDPDDEIDPTSNFEIVSISWETDAELREAVSITNVGINDGVRLSVDTVFDRIIENFEGVAGAVVDNYTGELTESNTTQIVYVSNAAQGDTAARFETINSRSATFTKTFGQAQDWSSYDTLVVFVKNLLVSHAGVTLSIYDSDDVIIASYILLTADEVTTDENLDNNGFAKKEFDISTFDVSEVKKIVIKTNSISNETEAFFIDTIYLRSNEFLLPSGNIRFRKSTTAPVIFNSVEYGVSMPSGSDIQVRVRVAATESDLATATYTSLLQSGESFALTGRVCEIDITLLSNTARTAGPTLDLVVLNILVPAETSGLTISSATAWNDGLEKVNIEITDTGDDTSVMSMKNTEVGNFYFINESQVSELNTSFAPVVGINAQAMPMSPVQGEHQINPPSSEYDPYGLERSDTRGLYKPLSAYRLDSGNYIVADTYNDRVMEITADGIFVRGWGSHCYDTSADSLYALTSLYNPRLGVLFITFSQTTDIRNFDLTNIRIIIGNVKEIRLSNENDKVRYPDGTIVTDRSPGANSTNPPTNNIGDTERILTILLSADKREILDSTIAAVQVSVSANIQDRIECFIGDFTYFGSFGIHRPIYANNSGENRVIIANSSVLNEFTKVVQTFPIIEFTKDIGELVDGQSLPLGLTFSYDQLLFSDIMLGSLQVTEILTDDGELKRRLLIAGIKFNQEAAANAAISSGNSATGAGNVLSVTLSPLEDKKMQLFTGVVRMIDMDSQLVMFEYICSDGKYPSDAFIDEDENVVVAESSFLSQSGRIVTLYANGIGDGQTPPIIKLIEGGVYTKIWDIRQLKENHIYIST